MFEWIKRLFVKEEVVATAIVSEPTEPEEISWYELECCLLDPFFDAVAAGEVEVVEEILEAYDAIISHWNSIHGMNTMRKKSLIIAAIKSGKLEMIQLLLKNGADPNCVNDYTTPIEQVIITQMPNWKAALEMLLEYGANIKGSNSFQALCHFGGEESASIAKYLREKGAIINERTSRGWSPLHSLGPNHGPEFIRTMIELGAEPNMITRNNETPIDMLDESRKHLEIWAHERIEFGQANKNALAMAEELRKHGGKRGAKL